MKKREFDAGKTRALEDAKTMSKEEIMRQIEVRSGALARYCEFVDAEPIPYEYGYIKGLEEALHERIRKRKVLRMLKILKRRWK